MSDEMLSCHICGKESHHLCNCNNCRQQCCTQCLNSHSNNKLCQLITKYVTNVSNLCKNHNGGVYTGYCLECSEQTCDMCSAIHSDHPKCNVDLTWAMTVIKEHLRSCKEIYSMKEAQAKNVIYATTEEISKLVSFETELKEEGGIWKSLVAKIKFEMKKQVPQHMAKLEEICDKMKEHQFLVQEMINNFDSLENVNFVWTFYPLWFAVLDELDSFKQLDMSVPKSCSFHLCIENRLPDISVCTIETRDFKSLIKEKENLERDVLKLEKELEKAKLTSSRNIEQKMEDNKRLEQLVKQLNSELQETKLASKDIEQKMIENKRLEQDVQQLKCELEENKNKSKSIIEQKIGENKRLEQNIQQLKSELKETQLALKVLSLEKEEMDKSIQDLLRIWSDESDNITKPMDQFKTTMDMIEFLKNKINQLKGLASLKDKTEILKSLNLLRESVMQLQSDKDRAHDRTNIATDAKSGQAVVDFVLKHIFRMNEKLRDIEQTVGENKQLEQHVQQSKSELQESKLASRRDIEQKKEENKRLEQNIQQLKTELQKSKLASSVLSIEKEEMDKSIQDLLRIWSDESDNITKPMDQLTTTMDKIEFLKNKIIQLKGLNSLTEREKETEVRTSENGVNDKEVFMKDKTEILRSINLLRESVMQLQSNEDIAHDRTNIATDAKSGQAVVDFVLKHIFEMNEKLIKLESDLNVEIEKRTDLINEGATEAVMTRDSKYKDELEAKKVMLEKLENSNFNLDEKIKDLQTQILQCKQQNCKSAEENHIFCKERDELKTRVESMEESLNKKEKELSRMSAAVEYMKKLVAEKQNEIKVIQEDREKKKHTTNELISQLSQMKNTVLDLQRMNAQQKGLIHNQEEIISAVKCEKDDLQTRLSSVAGEKLTKGNPSITDLGDPNRPMKISEKYGELYDNEWTDAMDNNKAVKECYKGLADSEIEEIIIFHLHRILKCCYKECLAKADEQIQTLGKAFAETMCLTFDSKEEVICLPVCKEASVFKRAKSVDFAKFLFENKILCRNVMDDWNYNYKNEKVMQLMMTSSFFEKCVLICWSMAIQDPVMYLDEDVPAETPIDKNTYKEFVKSGNTVAFVVWPALFLHKDGPLLYKGVVQAYWK